jgi:hypothetical protein
MRRGSCRSAMGFDIIPSGTNGNAEVHDPAYYASGGTRQIGRRLCGAFQAVQRSCDLSMAWICWRGTHDASHGDRLGVKQLTEKMGPESTELSGRVIRALSDDPNLLTLSGKTILAAEMAEHYDISGPGRVRAEIFAWNLWRPSSCL